MNVMKSTMLALTALLLGACASGYHDTKVLSTQESVEKAAQSPYQSVVVGVLVDHPLRQQLENDIAAQLTTLGVKATAAHTLYGDKGIKGKSREYLAGRLEEYGFDSALAIHLEDQSSQDLEVKSDPGTSVPVAGGMTMRPEVFSPDFYITEDIYMGRMDFWDVNQRAIVWRGKIASFNTGGMKGLKKGTKNFARTITKPIKNADLF